MIQLIILNLNSLSSMALRFFKELPECLQGIVKGYLGLYAHILNCSICSEGSTCSHQVQHFLSCLECQQTERKLVQGGFTPHSVFLAVSDDDDIIITEQEVHLDGGMILALGNMEYLVIITNIFIDFDDPDREDEYDISFYRIVDIYQMIALLSHGCSFLNLFPFYYRPDEEPFTVKTIVDELKSPIEHHLHDFYLGLPVDETWADSKIITYLRRNRDCDTIRDVIKRLPCEEKKLVKKAYKKIKKRVKELYESDAEKDESDGSAGTGSNT